MNAQEIINQSDFPDYLELFYPTLFVQQQADTNLTKCLRDMEWK